MKEVYYVVEMVVMGYQEEMDRKEREEIRERKRKLEQQEEQVLKVEE